MKLFTALLAVILSAGNGSAAQTPAGRWLTFTLDRAGAPPVHFELRVDEITGHGFYGVLPVAAPGAGTAAPTPDPVPMVFTDATVKKLFAAVPRVESARCETHDKGIAKTGVKNLRYAAGDRVFTCTYNYSDDERVNTATELFEAIAETMQFGDRLAAKLRFDRLGLDTELGELERALGDGRAIEVSNIAPVLERIQNDDRVMDRVRRKATHLLGSASSGASESSDPGPANLR